MWDSKRSKFTQSLRVDEDLIARIRTDTRWFKYDWDDLCVKKSQFVPVIFEPPCIITTVYAEVKERVSQNAMPSAAI